MPKDVMEELSEALGDLKTKAAAMGDLGDLSEKLGRLDEIGEQVSTLEQKMDRGLLGGGLETKPKTWGEQFTGHDGLKAFNDETSRPGRFRLEMKTTITTAANSGGAFDVPHRDAPNLMPRRRMTVRNLLPVVQISSNASNIRTRPAGRTTRPLLRKAEPSRNRRSPSTCRRPTPRSSRTGSRLPDRCSMTARSFAT